MALILWHSSHWWTRFMFPPVMYQSALWLLHPTEFSKIDSMWFPRWVMKSDTASFWLSWNLCLWQAIDWDAPSETRKPTCEKFDTYGETASRGSWWQPKASSTFKPSHSISQTCEWRRLQVGVAHTAWAHPKPCVFLAKALDSMEHY